MYVTTVLADIERRLEEDDYSVSGDDLYRLNEAVFNLGEEDQIDRATAARMFALVHRIQEVHKTRAYNHSDKNWPYDYRAMLGTLQNQEFFSEQNNEQLISWLDDSFERKPAYEGPIFEPDSVRKLKQENTKLREMVMKLKKVAEAVTTVQSYCESGKTIPENIKKTLEESEEKKATGSGKGKGRSKGRGKGGK